MAFEYVPMDQVRPYYNVYFRRVDGQTIPIEHDGNTVEVDALAVSFMLRVFNRYGCEVLFPLARGDGDTKRSAFPTLGIFHIYRDDNRIHSPIGLFTFAVEPDKGLVVTPREGVVSDYEIVLTPIKYGAASIDEKVNPVSLESFLISDEQFNALLANKAMGGFEVGFENTVIEEDGVQRLILVPNGFSHAESVECMDSKVHFCTPFDEKGALTHKDLLKKMKAATEETTGRGAYIVKTTPGAGTGDD